MAEPTENTAWATDVSALKTATNVTRQNLGWQTLPDNLPAQTGERPNLNEQNYWQFAVHTWIQYLNTEITTDTGAGAYVRQDSPTINTPVLAGGTFSGAHSSGSVAGGIVGSGINGSNITVGIVGVGVGGTGTTTSTGSGDVVLSASPTFTGTAAFNNFTGAHTTGSVAGGIVTSGIDGDNVTAGTSGTGDIIRSTGNFTGNHNSGFVAGGIITSGINGSNITVGIVPVTNGGTGTTTSTGSGATVRAVSPSFTGTANFVNAQVGVGSPAIFGVTSVSSGNVGSGFAGVIQLRTTVADPSDNVYVRFKRNTSTDVGGIARNGTTNECQFFNLSDRRTKYDIRPLGGEEALDRIMRATVNRFRQRDNRAENIDFVAQELYEIFPDWVGKTDDGLGDTVPTGVKPWTIQKGKLPLWNLCALQELCRRIEKIEASVA